MGWGKRYNYHQHARTKKSIDFIKGNQTGQQKIPDFLRFFLCSCAKKGGCWVLSGAQTCCVLPPGSGQNLALENDSIWGFPWMGVPQNLSWKIHFKQETSIWFPIGSDHFQIFIFFMAADGLPTRILSALRASRLRGLPLLRRRRHGVPKVAYFGILRRSKHILDGTRGGNPFLLLWPVFDDLIQVSRCRAWILSPTMLRCDPLPEADSATNASNLILVRAIALDPGFDQWVHHAPKIQENQAHESSCMYCILFGSTSSCHFSGSKRPKAIGIYRQ